MAKEGATTKRRKKTAKKLPKSTSKTTRKSYSRKKTVTPPPHPLLSSSPPHPLSFRTSSLTNWIITQEGPVKRPFIRIPHPTLPLQQVLFYRSSGLSNDTSDLTGGTWFPLVGIVTPENLSYFQTYRDALLGSETTKPLEIGHLLKMSVLYQIYNQTYNENHPGFMRRSYYTREMTNLMISFVNTLIKEEQPGLSVEDKIRQIREIMDYTRLVGKLHTYFSEVWQIVWSISFAPEANLWKNNPRFVEFIRTQYPDLTPPSFSFPLSSSEIDVLVEREPTYSLESTEMQQFVHSMNPIEYIQQVVSQEKNFANYNQEFLQYRENQFKLLRSIERNKGKPLPVQK